MASKWLRRARPRRAFIAGLVAALLTAVGWLGWRVLVQDEQLASQRAGEDREVAADLVVAASSQRLSAIERDLDAALSGRESGPGVESSGAVVVRITDDEVRASPGNRLRYYPHLPPRSTSPDAEALVRTAQNAFKAGTPVAALGAYDRLEALGAMPIGDVVGGIPAALFAQLGRMTVHEREGNEVSRVAAARALDTALRSGQWPVSAATYEFLNEQIGRALPDVSKRDDQLVVAEATTWLWERRSLDPGFPPSGRTSRMFSSGPALLVWRSAAETLLASIADRRALEEVWVSALKPVLEPRRARLAISTPEGQLVLGTSATSDRAAVRLASVTALPWTIQITNTADTAVLGDRRRLLMAGMSVLFVLIIAGAWLIERTVARELAVADLQSDFVSAVSHEFRTPLTTLCQLSEMLVRDRVASDEDRRQYYRLLHGESHRLRRLVETLLDFGRLEAGRMEFRFEDVDVGELVRSTIAEFSHSRQAREHRVELSADDTPMTLRADADVLKTVVWNLLENAAKYSPECDTIWVTLRRRGSEIALEVRDRGVGIPRGEQRQVFEKFVRGAGARASDVGGVGVGLAMARRIVEAHGGAITLESQPGTGSTFLVMLPMIQSQIRADLKVGPYSGVEAAG
jgi:signal transduction histidine kinase